MRILELELPTSALGSQRRFYTRDLGLELMDDGARGFTVQAGGTMLSFTAVAEEPGALHLAFNVPENRLSDARAWLAQRAPLIPGPDGEEELDFSGWNADAVYCLDPAGNVVELIARHALANATEEPFGARSLLEVSEIGVPVDDVPATVAFLEEGLRIPLWDGDRRGFTVLGDDRGLFIVVPRGRAWFPTDRPAHTPPCRVGIAGSPAATYERTPLGAAVSVRPA